jgi:SAM-dependent methyltransferase
MTQGTSELEVSKSGIKILRVMAKLCERCGVEIPNEFVNALCWACYEGEVASQTPQSAPQNAPGEALPLIGDPSYVEREEVAELEMPERILKCFQSAGKVLWGDRVAMYNYIKDFGQEVARMHPQYPKFVWLPKIADVGCGLGIGSNILSQGADFVWGIDKNPRNISWASQCFTRHKNHIYYTPQLTFDVLDVTSDEREVMAFDIVVAFEIFEHIKDVDKLMVFLKKLCKKNKHGVYYRAGLGEAPPQKEPYGTFTFISTPNRNAPAIHKDTPFNEFHVRELTSQEFKRYLLKWYEKVELIDWTGNPEPDDTQLSPILARCTLPV